MLLLVAHARVRISRIHARFLACLFQLLQSGLARLSKQVLKNFHRQCGLIIITGASFMCGRGGVTLLVPASSTTAFLSKHGGTKVNHVSRGASDRCQLDGERARVPLFFLSFSQLMDHLRRH